MPGLTVQMTADEADLFAKLTSVINKTNESERAFSKASDQSKEAAKAAREAAKQQEQASRAASRLADKLARDNESLEESYARQKKALTDAMASGTADTKKLQAGIQTLERKMHDLAKAEAATGQQGADAMAEYNRAIKSGIAISKRMEAQTKDLSDEHVSLKADIKAAFAAGKISAQQYEQSLKGIDSELGKHEPKLSNQSKITGDLATKVGGMVTIWGSIEKGISFATEALNAHNERMKESLELTKGMNAGNLDLGSVSDSPQELKARMDQVRTMRTQYGLSMEESQGTVFALDSAGLLSADPAKAKEDQRTVDFFSKVGQVTDAKKFVQVAGQMKASFGLQPAESVNATMTTAKLSMMETPEFARLLGEASQGTSQMQSQDRKLLAAETAATVAALSDTMQGSTGTIVSGAASKFAQVPQLQGMSFRDATKAALAMSPDERDKLFGQNESVQKYLNDSAKQSAEIDDFVNQARQAISNSGTQNSAVAKQLATQRIANPNFDKINTINAIKARREYEEMDHLSGRAGDLEIQDEMMRAAYAAQYENTDQGTISGKLKSLVLSGSQHFYNTRRWMNMTNTGTLDQSVLESYHARQMADAPNLAAQARLQQRFESLPSQSDQGSYIDMRPLTELFKAQTDAIEKAAVPKLQLVTKPGDDS